MKTFLRVLLVALITAAFSTPAFAKTIVASLPEEDDTKTQMTFSIDGKEDDEEEDFWEDFALPSFKGEQDNKNILNSKSIISQIENNKKGTIKANITDSPNVEKSVFKSLSEKNDTSVMFSSDKYYWIFAGGKEISSEKPQYNLGLKFTSPYEFRYKRLLPDERTKLVCLNFYDDISLPYEGKITVKTKLGDGEYAYVYQYNKEKSKAKLIANEVEVGAKGKVSFNISSTKDLFITNKPIKNANILQ